MDIYRIYYDSGEVEYEYWYKDDVGISYYESGNIQQESWYKNDEYHRLNGPALIYYDEEGNIQKETWYLNGQDKTDEINEWIDTYPLPENNVLFKLTWA